MVLIVKTDLIQQALKEAGKETRDDAIDHKELYRIAKSLENPKFQYQLLLKNCKFYYPPKVKKEMSKEYIEMMDRARNIVAEKEYNEMTRGLEKIDPWDPKELKIVKSQITAVINVLFSIVAVFTAVFYLGELVHLDIGLRVLFALFGALVVAIAEGWFFTKDLLYIEKK